MPKLYSYEVGRTGPVLLAKAEKQTFIIHCDSSDDTWRMANRLNVARYRVKAQVYIEADPVALTVKVMPKNAERVSMPKKPDSPKRRKADPVPKFKAGPVEMYQEIADKTGHDAKDIQLFAKETADVLNEAVEKYGSLDAIPTTPLADVMAELSAKPDNVAMSENQDIPVESRSVKRRLAAQRGQQPPQWEPPKESLNIREKGRCYDCGGDLAKDHWHERTEVITGSKAFPVTLCCKCKGHKV